MTFFKIIPENFNHLLVQYLGLSGFSDGNKNMYITHHNNSNMTNGDLASLNNRHAMKILNRVKVYNSIYSSSIRM